MNKVVTSRHVKASELPAELRGEIPEHATVTVTVELESAATAGDDPVAMLKRFRASRGDSGRSVDDIVREIRALRDEWDDR